MTLEEEWFRKVFQGLVDQVRLSERHRAISIDGKELGKVVSERLAMALSQRVGKKARNKLFQKYLSEYKGGDVVVAEFCQAVAIESVFEDGMHEWKRRISRISDRYKNGIRSFGGWRPWRYMTGRDPMSLEVAIEIRENNEIFPIALVGWAERVYRAAGIARKVVPVGNVAEREKWFQC